MISVMAEEQYRRAEALLRAGRLSEAQRAIRKCIEAAPYLSPPWALAAIIALNQGKLVQAADDFGKALSHAHAPEEVAPNWVGRGRCLVALGRVEEGLECFVCARRIYPRFAPAMEGEAVANMELGRYAEAEKAAHAALSLENSPRSRLILARSVLFQGRIDEAEKMLRPLCTDININFEAKLHLAGIKRARGFVSEAACEFRDLLQEKSDYPAYYELAKSKRFETAEDPDLLFIKDAFDRFPSNSKKGIDQQAAIRLHVDLSFALGKAEEETGQYAQAFRHYSIGNDLHSKLESTDLGSVRRLVEEARSVNYCRLAASVGSALVKGVPSPLLIVSPPRSGSSLLEQMLAVHPEIQPGGETGVFLKVANAAVHSIQNLETENGADIREQLLSTLSVYPTCSWVTDKSLDSFIYLELIAALLPQTRFIVLERHPMDTAWSQFTQLFATGMGWTYSMESIVEYAALYHEVVESWKSCYQDRIIVIYYEALVVNPRDELRRVTDFLGLEYHENCLHYEHLQRPVWTASNAQIRESLNRRGMGRWLPFKSELVSLYESWNYAINRYESILWELQVPYCAQTSHDVI